MSKTHFYGRVAAEETFSDYLRRTFTDPQEVCMVESGVPGDARRGTQGVCIRPNPLSPTLAHLRWPRPTSFHTLAVDFTK